MTDEANREVQLIAQATAARENAYAPYSGFQVGAALQTLSGGTYTGVNVENASYGLTCCAERNAIAAAVAGGMQPGGLAALAVVTGAQSPTPPCGACRQVIAEFAAPSLQVISSTTTGQTKVWSATELLPDSFKLG